MRKISFVTITTLLSVGILTQCSPKKDAHQAQAVSGHSPAVKTVAVKTLQPSRVIVLPGDLRPWEVVDIQAKVKGYVNTVNADRGLYVKKGQVLATLEAPELKAQLAESMARVEDYQSQFLASRLTYQRMVQTSRTPGAVAFNELDIARSKMIVDSMQVLSAKEAYKAKKEMVNYLTIVAPFNGIITERTISPGELVGPDGAKMFVLENSETLRVTVAIPEIYSTQLTAGAAVSFKVNAIPERVFKARLSRSSQSLDVSIRSMYAEFDVANEGHLLKSGMYAEVSLPIERSVATLFVPSTAVVNSTERVFVIEVADHRAKWVNVKTGAQVDSLVEVFGPLKEGEEVVAKASEEIRDGSMVH